MGLPLVVVVCLALRSCLPGRSLPGPLTFQCARVFRNEINVPLVSSSPGSIITGTRLLQLLICRSNPYILRNPLNALDLDPENLT